jgi:hypothetical protein
MLDQYVEYFWLNTRNSSRDLDKRTRRYFAAGMMVDHFLFLQELQEVVGSGGGGGGGDDCMLSLDEHPCSGAASVLLGDGASLTVGGGLASDCFCVE